MLNIYIYIFITYDLLCFSMFVTLPSGIPLRYLLKNYCICFLQCCDVVCAVKYKVHPVFFVIYKFTL
jgi:hypothetical protein